jgi:hypothetical protein
MLDNRMSKMTSKQGTYQGRRILADNWHRLPLVVLRVQRQWNLVSSDIRLGRGHYSKWAVQDGLGLQLLVSHVQILPNTMLFRHIML